MKKLTCNSLIIKIGVIVFLVEAAVLAPMGLYYTQRFSSEIDHAVRLRVQQPGLLMNRQLLRYDAVEDTREMTGLVGDEFLEGLVFGRDGMIYHAHERALVGDPVQDHTQLTAEEYQSLDAPLLFSESGSDETSLISVTPIYAFEGAEPFFFVYVKVRTTAAEERKAAVLQLFLAGSALCILLTSLALIAAMRLFITRPLEELETSATALAEGNLNQPIPAGRSDELGSLARSFSRMRDALRDQIEQLTAANLRLTELDSMKSAFLSSVSHELRTPLTSILGYSKLITRSLTRHFASQPSEDAEASRKEEQIIANLEVIRKEGERLTRLINDVLDLNRIEAGRMTWQDVTTDPGELLRQAGSVASGHFAHKDGVELVLDIPADLPPVLVDPDKMQQVLINLLHNAAKFTKRGQVSARILPPRPESVEPVLTFEVQDTGPGFSPQAIPLLFEKFHQLPASDTLESSGGAGLGLAICKEIIEHYGGSIWAVSMPGQGSTFSFTLPVAEG